MISFTVDFFLRRIFSARSVLWKLAFETISLFFTLMVIYYASESFLLKQGPTNSSLFVFLLVGEIAFVIPMCFAERLLTHFLEIRNLQFYQTLIGLRLSPVKFIFKKAVQDSLFPVLRVNLIIFFSIVFLHFHFSFFCIIIFFLFQILAMAIFSVMALITSLLHLKFNRGIGFFYTLQSVAAIIGGVYFPINVFPDLLKNISLYLPQTQILYSARLILNNQPLELASVCITFVWLVVLGCCWFFLNRAINGSLKLRARYL